MGDVKSACQAEFDLEKVRVQRTVENQWDYRRPDFRYKKVVIAVVAFILGAICLSAFRLCVDDAALIPQYIDTPSGHVGQVLNEDIFPISDIKELADQAVDDDDPSTSISHTAPTQAATEIESTATTSPVTNPESPTAAYAVVDAQATPYANVSSSTSTAQAIHSTSIDVTEATTSTSAATDLQAAEYTEPATKLVPGLAFDRFVMIWHENTDYEAASSDPNFTWLASQGISLTNFFGITHWSQANYLACLAGCTLGADEDAPLEVPENITNVMDILEDRGISWAQYSEDMPYSGFTGEWYTNPDTNATGYVRKHNAAVQYLANLRPDRAGLLKNLTSFYEDLANDNLPQWIFINPNQTNDGHDAGYAAAGTWTRDFLEPLYADKKFMSRTAVLICFDENQTHTSANRVVAMLLGDAIPPSLVGTVDATFYNHYSEISSIEANWNLKTLGRWDVGANVFDFVAKESGDTNRDWPAITGDAPTRFLNQSYGGPLNSINNHFSWPIPNVELVRNGRAVLPRVAEVWGATELQKTTFYTDTVELPDGLNAPDGWAV